MRDQTPTTLKLMTAVGGGLLFAIAMPLLAFAQEALPGQTGISHPDDLIFARQLLMDEFENRMPAFDAAAAGGDFDFAALKDDAYLFSSLFAIFPHLLPPETRPAENSDDSALPTNATAAVWDDFETFYELITEASTLAFDMSISEDPEQFREQTIELRAACDSCHEVYLYVPEPSVDQ